MWFNIHPPFRLQQLLKKKRHLLKLGLVVIQLIQGKLLNLLDLGVLTVL